MSIWYKAKGLLGSSSRLQWLLEDSVHSSASIPTCVFLIPVPEFSSCLLLSPTWTLGGVGYCFCVYLNIFNYFHITSIIFIFVTVSLKLFYFFFSPQLVSLSPLFPFLFHFWEGREVNRENLETSPSLTLGSGAW